MSGRPRPAGECRSSPAADPTSAAVRRVLVIGNGGAGKSTLATEIAARTGLPYVGLDGLYWKRDWQPTRQSEWERLVRRTIEPEAWVLDGNYRGTLPMRIAACDTIVFLDTPRRVCLRRLLVRRLRRHGRVRPGLPEGCVERLSPSFLRWVWRYPTDARPGVLRLLEESKANRRVAVLRNRRDRRTFLDTLDAVTPHG